jgi:hypothetical protein
VYRRDDGRSRGCRERDFNRNRMHASSQGACEASWGERLKSTMHGSDGMGKSRLMRKLSAVALAGAAEASASGGKELAGASGVRT